MKKLLTILTILTIIFLIGCSDKGTPGDADITEKDISDAMDKAQEITPTTKGGCKGFLQPSSIQTLAKDSTYSNCVSQSEKFGMSEKDVRNACYYAHEFSKAIMAKDLAKFDSLSSDYISENNYQDKEPLLSARFIYREHFSIINKKPEACDGLWSQTQIDASRYYKDLMKNQIVWCKASASGDSSVCSGISGDDAESDKITCEARAKKDPSLCEDVTFNKQGCLTSACGWA